MGNSNSKMEESLSSFVGFVVHPRSVANNAKKDVEPYISGGHNAVSWLTPPV